MGITMARSRVEIGGWCVVATLAANTPLSVGRLAISGALSFLFSVADGGWAGGPPDQRQPASRGGSRVAASRNRMPPAGWRVLSAILMFLGNRRSQERRNFYLR